MKKIILVSLFICLWANAQVNDLSKMQNLRKVEKMNPLLTDFGTKYTTAPFSQIELQHYGPAFEKAIQEAKEQIDAIVNNPEKATFANTIEALDFSGDRLDRISSLFFNLNSADTNPEMQELAQKFSPKLTEFSNDIALNAKLFARIKTVYDTKEQLNLSEEQKMLLDKKYKSFSRNGALLNAEDKEKLRSIDQQLAKLSLTFGENLLAEGNAYTLQITNISDLEGLPEGIMEAAKAEAQSRNMEGWVFTLDYPSYVPFVTYAKNRELRKEITLAFGKRAFQGNEHDNQEIIKKIATLRFQRAQLLGYKSHADFVLEERMAQTPEKVNSFLNDLLTKAKPAAQKEFKQLADFAKKTDGITSLERWDGAYYSEKLKQKLFSFDNEKLKPYFKLENVLNGAFIVSEKLYGIHFKEVNDIDKYNPEVQTFEVLDTQNNLIAVLYTDFFPRKGKRNGAWMTSFKNQYLKNGVNERPHVSIVCNFTKPTETKPSLLSFDEVTTLFHEFGHALHGMLANTVYPSLSGTSVSWDFVELPSQVMENWCYQPEALALFAKHYETGEVIPQSYVKKISESANFLEGMATLRQLSFGMLDMAYHSTNPSDISRIKAFENQAIQSTSLYPDVAETAVSPSFSHIFSGGYSAGYYSYKWAEVLDADAFEYFKQNGIFNKDIAKQFREFVLSKGGTEQPMKLYVDFRGQEPKPDALLKRAGLLTGK